MNASDRDSMGVTVTHQLDVHTKCLDPLLLEA